MAFDAWLKKMDNHSRIELLHDLLAMLSNDDKAELVDQLATELNDNGYEWDYHG